MILPAHLHTANQILTLVGLGKFPEVRTAAALIAVHLANLPPEPEMWGATPEPKSSEDHVRDAIVDACRVVKAVGWVPDAMTVAIIATAEVGSAYAAWTRLHVWIAQMDRTPRHPSTEDRPLDGEPASAWVEARRRREGSSAETAEELEDRLEALPELAGVNVEVREADHLVVLIGGDGEHAAIACRAAGPAWASWTFTADEDDKPTFDAMAEAPVVTDTGGSSVAQMFPDGGSDEPVTDPAWEGAIGEICAEVEAVTAAAQVEAFPTATESRALARTLVDVILDSHGLETGPDGVVRKVDTTVPDEAVTYTKPIVGHVVEVVTVEDPDFSPTGPADEPKPKKPRCGKVYGQKESMPPIPMVCTRPEGHKGGCGEAKVVGKKA